MSDSAASYPSCPAAPGARRKALDLAAGDRARDAFRIRPVNRRRGQSKGFLRDFRGVAAESLDSYLRWLRLIGLADLASSRACLGAAMDSESIRFAN